jgi:hypothetical protein
VAPGPRGVLNDRPAGARQSRASSEARRVSTSASASSATSARFDAVTQAGDAAPDELAAKAGPFERARGGAEDEDHGDDRHRAQRNADGGRQQVADGLAHAPLLAAPAVRNITRPG